MKKNLFISDVLMFSSIFWVSIFCVYSTAMIKLGFLVLKVKAKITSLELLIGLLDQKIIILDEQIKSNILQGVNSKMVIAGVLFLGVIAILWFFFSGGGGSGPGGSASFSNVDLSTNITNNSLAHRLEDIVVQTPLELVNTSLRETLDKMNILLLPNVSKWLTTFTEKNVEPNSINVNLGKSINSWLITLEQIISPLLKEKGLSTENLQDLECTIKAMDQTLDSFILQTEDFLISSNLNTLPKSHTDLAREFEFVSKTREVANELLQKLVDNQIILKEILPGTETLFVPEWFPGILGFFFMMSIICSQQMIDLHLYIAALLGRLPVTQPLNSGDVNYQKNLIGSLTTLFFKLISFIKTPQSFSYHGPGEFLRVNETNPENIDVFSKLLKALFEHHICLNIDFVNIILI